MLARSGRGDDVVSIAIENVGLGARRVVLGELADRTEERTAGCIVEIFRRDRRGRRQQSGDERPALGGRIVGAAVDDTRIALVGAGGRAASLVMDALR